MAASERVRLTTQHNAAEAQRKKKQKAEEALNAEEKAQKAEADWKEKEAIDLDSLTQFTSEWSSK